MILHRATASPPTSARFFGAQPVDWFASYPLFSIIVIVAWQWLPFATLILLTSLSRSTASRRRRRRWTAPRSWSRSGTSDASVHRGAPSSSILIQMIFLLGVYAEILVTTNGGPGYASTNLPFLDSAAPRSYQADVGGAAAEEDIVYGHVLANIVAIF